MNIAIVTHYFWPEPFIINDIAKRLHENGHKVTVLTGKPNYPDGKIYKGYRFFGYKKEQYKGVEVIRIPLVPRGRGGGLRLLMNYLSFVFFGLISFPFLCRRRKFDAILVYTPSPLTSTIPAIFLRFLKRTKLCLWVQDLWPESLSATGYVKNRFALKLTSIIVKWIYRKSDRILIQSEAFRGPVEKLADPEKIIFYPNSIDGSVYSKVKIEKNEYFGKDICNKTDRFSVAFAGNIGSAQSIENIIAAAEILSSENIDADIYIIGSGSKLEWATKEVERLGLENVIFPGRFPMDSMPAILSQADALLVTLKDEPIFSYTVPSKVQAYLATGKPVIASLNGEGARIIVEEAKAGLACNAEDPEGLARAVIELSMMNASDRDRLGQNGKAYFDTHYDMNKLVPRLVEVIKE